MTEVKGVPVMDPSIDDEAAQQLREMAEAAEALAKNPDAFQQAVDAFHARDASRFQAALDIAGVGERCELICRFICEKLCIRLCFLFCPEPPSTPIDVAEMRAFAEALANLVKDEESVKRLLTIVETEDVQAWNAALQRLNLTQFCHQLCHFLCFELCEFVCEFICLRPLITRVGSIPTSQIGPLGFGNGPSIPPGQVPSPNPGVGVGDHPFGGLTELRGLFNFPTAVQYLVEVSSNPAGPYQPIITSVTGYDASLNPVTRFPSGGADPGWFDIAQIPFSDGGNSTFGEKVLLYWPTPSPDGIYYLRLRVRDAALAELVSTPQIVQVDNTPPGPFPNPLITLQLQKPDGTRTELKCGKVKRGDGLIVVTIQAFYPNFSRLSVNAEGNSTLSVPVVDTSGTSLSKTYNGNLADQGYPVPTEFLWDPWSDPNIIPCCYIVRVDIWDRAVVNNNWSGGHGNTGWQAIEIGL